MGSKASQPTVGADSEQYEIPLRRLRQPATVNLFKIGVLEGAHVAGMHQAKEVMQAMTKAGLDGVLDVRTWKGWFGDPRPRRARRDGVVALDRYLDAVQDPRRSQFPEASPTSRFFVALLEDGLASRLLAPTEAKAPEIALAQRALEYKPESAVHLHFDAIEAVSMSEGNGEVGWEKVKAICAKRVMQLLHQRWSPRNGTIYRELTPSLELRWTWADADERARILRRYGQLQPNMFEAHRRAVPYPCWDAAGIAGDEPEGFVHRLLLGLSTDSDFLVADRFQAWALDLASAAFAMHALAWTERYETHGVRVSPELVFWRALEQLYLSDEPDDVIRDGLVAALELISASWTDETLDTLHRARRWYRRILSDLGLDVCVVAETVRRCWRVRPIVYRGG
ncbi:hypothetical protein [Roseateles sp. BYS87W]|uniref:Aminoglycoside phosphotransferase domain-containing protein n=1 Tax=Pelomonas baiyunensis TaxID=3299026 RepID=A0ABW7GT64_9BURK